MQYAWLILGLISAAGAAGVAILGRIGLGAVDTTLATTLRSIVMTLILVVVSLAAGKLNLAGGVDSISTRSWWYIVLAGLSGAVSWLAYFAALKLGAAGQVAAVDRLSVAFVFILAVLLLGERYSWRGWVGVALVIVGIYLIALERPTTLPQTQPAKAS